MSKFSRLTIRTKLILIIMGITVGVLVAASAVSIGYDAHTNRQVTKDYLNALAESISSSNAKALAARDTDFSQQALEKLQYQKSILFACIFDEQGRPFVAYQRDGNARTCATLPVADLIRPQINRVVVSHQILLGDRSIGTVVLASSTNELMANLRWDIKFSLAMLIAAFSGGLSPRLPAARNHFASDPVVGLDREACVRSEGLFDSRAVGCGRRGRRVD